MMITNFLGHSAFGDQNVLCAVYIVEITEEELGFLTARIMAAFDIGYRGSSPYLWTN
jgi:hypothetical protein